MSVGCVHSHPICNGFVCRKKSTLRSRMCGKSWAGVFPDDTVCCCLCEIVLEGKGREDCVNSRASRNQRFLCRLCPCLSVS